MARLTKDGNWIISAAEVGTYVVCPESWRLKVIEGLENSELQYETIEAGNRLHDDWAARHSEELFFRKGIKILLLLIANAIALGIFIINT